QNPKTPKPQNPKTPVRCRAQYRGQITLKLNKEKGNTTHGMSWIIKKIFDWVLGLFWKKRLDLSVVGLQNAGKTTLVNTMSGEYDQDTISTIGFNMRQLKKGNVNLKIWDLGGQKQFRDSWETYCRTSDVMVFVVDSTDFAGIDTAREELHQLVSWPSLEGIPLLVLGNKNDLEHALSEEQLIVQLQLAKIKGRKIAVYSISAKKRVNIEIAVTWIGKQPKRKR
ncbi:MAG: ADP-ribosylation factor-like protein, partial [Candidatus Pacebacteria bacterium]|nr:ADP-ribosylation factor-like protein [Candidatus Paceibacterota bacterium]